MMQNKDIATAVLQKAAIRKKQQSARKRKRYRAAALAASGACILITAFTMPQWMSKVTQDTPTNHTTMGTFFASSAWLGYVVMGIGAFALGVLVTLFCYKLKDDETRR